MEGIARALSLSLLLYFSLSLEGGWLEGIALEVHTDRDVRAYDDDDVEERYSDLQVDSRVKS